MKPETNYDKLDEFRIVKNLGSGSQATVKLGIDNNNMQVAIKLYDKENLKSYNYMTKQLEIVKELNHENIVRLIDCRYNAKFTSEDGTSKEYFALILEYLGGGELFNFIAKTGKFSEKMTRTFFNQMMNGLNHMHTKGFVHRDLKPENIVLSSKFVLKLTDFGFARPKKPDQQKSKIYTFLGSHGYMAPEIYQGGYDGEKTDVFAAGVILFIMYTGAKPFNRPTPNDDYYKFIMAKQYQNFWKGHQVHFGAGYFSNQFKQVVNSMIAFKPQDRLSMINIANLPWPNGEILTQAQIKLKFKERKQKLDSILKQLAAKQTQELDKMISQSKENSRSSSQQSQQFSLIQSSSSQNSRIIDLYQQELKLKRKLKIFYELKKDDLVLKTDSEYAIAYIINFLERMVIDLRSSPLDTVIISQSVDEKQLLRLYRLKDYKANLMKADFRFNYNHNQSGMEQKLQIDLTFGLDVNDNVVVRPVLTKGDILYFKKIIYELRKALAFAIIEN